MKEGERVYLGDGVYLSHDGYQFWLFTSNGIRDTNAIALEPDVMESFLQEVKKHEEEKVVKNRV